jgi:polyhydroxybutyrate depolymerase
MRRLPLILGFVVFLAACGGGGEEAGIGACEGLSEIESGTFDVAGREGAIVHVPDSYDPDNATPVVLVFHGGADSPEGAEVQTGFSNVADEEGFLAVYPIARKLTSLDRMWSLTTATQPTEMNELQRPMLSWLTEGLAEGNPDITYVENLLNELETMFCVDKSRVYATGHSMGGGFSHTLGCTLGDRIAAIGPASVWTVKGLGDCAPTRPLPIMGFFSIDDPGFEGGQWAPFVELWSFHEFGELWARLNNCTSGREPGDTSGDSSSDVWSGCSSPVIMWTLSDGGHTWPGGSQRFANTDINASETLWEFFTQHQLP